MDESPLEFGENISSIAGVRQRHEAVESLRESNQIALDRLALEEEKRREEKREANARDLIFEVHQRLEEFQRIHESDPAAICSDLVSLRDVVDSMEASWFSDLSWRLFFTETSKKFWEWESFMQSAHADLLLAVEREVDRLRKEEEARELEEQRQKEEQKKKETAAIEKERNITALFIILFVVILIVVVAII